MKILLVGATGAMGKIIAEISQEEKEIDIVAGVGAGQAQFDFPLYEDFGDIKEDFDCIIDFSNKDLTPQLLDYIDSSKKSAVIATTGLSDAIKNRMKSLSDKTPILYAQNMSVGVNTIDTIVGQLTQILSDFDVEIIEKHHNKKMDAPSGTAEMLFNTIKENKKEAYARYDRSRDHKRRDKNEVGVMSMRGGTIVGEHSVIFAGTDEVIEIKHSAGSKKIFGKGALRAARFLMTKDKGFYNMKDALR